jgi:putative SOS response-associated peptidase YedK
MIITNANELASKVHDRMPVLLSPDEFEPWLSGIAGTEILNRAPELMLQVWPVSRRVNSSRAPSDDPTLIEEVDLPRLQ